MRAVLAPGLGSDAAVLPPQADKGLATRQYSTTALNAIAPSLPELDRALRRPDPLQPDDIKEGQFQKAVSQPLSATSVLREHAMGGDPQRHPRTTAVALIPMAAPSWSSPVTWWAPCASRPSPNSG